ncbi:MAG TPA: polysaccharide deacetylase family protein [Solirubrobacteraceae bacterium]|nr:polysaccharide deacetylase family protein [Solirubrobacteraceae bacterium]
MAVTVTFDLEDNWGAGAGEQRFVAMSHRFFDFLQERGIVATVFVVGELARRHGELIRRAAEAGHEIGLHGLRHVPLADVGRSALPGELREGRALLEDVAQVPVLGFRAPIFSLTRASSWAIEQVHDAGFVYSSSVLPAANPLHGWPGAPSRPFRWDNGLIELPCPVGGVGPVQVPFLGGIYIRYVPLIVARRFLRGLGEGAVPWSYAHPYDLDTEEPFSVMPHAGWLVSRILHTRRGVTLSRLQAMIDAGGAPGRPLCEIVELLNDAELPQVASTS